MKTKSKYFLFIFFSLLSIYSGAQSLELSINNAGSCIYQGKIYAFGLRNSETGKKAKVIVYQLNYQLAKTDSFILETDALAESYLQLSSDSLHGFLNIYLQKKEKTQVEILRFGKEFKLLTDIKDIDIARLNGVSAFESGVFYQGKNLFTVKSVSDTSGLQFYLNKFALKSDQKNFEYEFKWQFPFDRKNIHSARVIYANENFVLMYVNILSGDKKGQWLVNVSQDGKLRKGSRIHDGSEIGFHCFGAIAMDSSSKNLIICGQRFSDAELDPAENKFNPVKTNLSLYINVLDTAGEMLERSSVKIPLPDPKASASKVPVNYIFRMFEFYQDKEQNLKVGIDLFKGNAGNWCFNYCNSFSFKIKSLNGKRLADKFVANTNPNIEKFYFNTDAADMNGKLCLDSLKEFEKLAFKQMALGVKAGFKMDDTQNPVWLLKKSEAKKGLDNYTVLVPVKKIYQLNKIQEAKKAENPMMMLLNHKQFALARQSAADKFFMQIFNW